MILYETTQVTGHVDDPHSTKLWSLPHNKKLENSTSQVTAMDTGHVLEGLVQNEDVGEKTTLQGWSLNFFQGEKTELVRFGHILQMDDDRLLKQVMHWETNSKKQRLKRPRTNWIDTVRQDSKVTGPSWNKHKSHVFDKEHFRWMISRDHIYNLIHYEWQPNDYIINFPYYYYV